jgi:RNA polymerase sigma factor for flagellar operon FliA
MYNAAGQLNKDQLVQRFAPLVRRIACHLMARLPASVQLDDLVQNGMLGLLDAIGRFEAGWGLSSRSMRRSVCVVQCSTACARTTGCRAACVATRRRIEAAIAQLEQENGRAPTEQELADSLGMALADYQQMLQDARGHQLVYLEDMVAERGEDFLERHLADEGGDPAKLLEDENLRRRLVQAIELLPERERLMMALYYEQDLNLREIGEVMGVTESRVCQLHSQAVMRLRARLFDGGGKGTTKVVRHG